MSNTESQINRIIALAAGLLILVFPTLLMSIPNGGGGALLLLIIVSLIGLYHNKEKIPLNKSEWTLLLVILFFCLVYIINIISFGKGFREFDDISRFLLLLPVFFYLRKTKININYFFGSLFFGAFTCALFGFYQKFYLDFERAMGITNAVPFGGISITLGLMCLPAVFLNNASKGFRALMLLAFFMGLAGSVFSATRGAWLALPVSFLVILLINPMNWGYLKKTAAGLIIILGMGSAYFLPSVQMRVDASIKHFGAYIAGDTTNTAVGLRLDVWKASAIAISETPFFGVGEGNFRQTMESLAEKSLVGKHIAEELAHAHNEYLYATLHRGLFGFISLMLVFLLPLYSLIKSSHKETGVNQIVSISGLILITSYMTFSLTDIVFGHQNTILFYAAYLYIIYGLISTHSQAKTVHFTTIEQSRQ